MQKINFKSLLIGIIIGTSLTVSATSVYATRAAKNIQADYHDMKVSVDGTVVTLKNAKGVVVEPFTYNDDTYLPARAIAEALGKKVGWDAASETVIISNGDGTVPTPGAGTVYFETIAPQKTFSNSELTAWQSTDRDLLANTYNHGYILRNTTGAPQIAEFALNSAYSSFSAKVVPIAGSLSTSASYTLNIYGDGELLYSTPAFTGTNPVYADDFDIDVTAVDTLKLELVAVGPANTGIGLVHGTLIVK